jgi:hypothetical protein
MNIQADNRHIIIGSIIISIVLCVCLVLFVTLLSSTQKIGMDGQVAKLGIVPYIAPTNSPEPTYTPILPTAEIVEGIQKGSVVQIMGTEGTGLNLRSDPALQSQQVFVALDAEVYQVSDGPIRADGYIWWQLTSPYNADRSGWAVSQYLTVIN